MDLQTGFQRVMDGEGLLFVGAGYSLGATNLRGTAFKAGAAIADHFASQTDLPQGTGLEDAAEAFAESKGVEALIQEVQEEFTASEVAPYHQRIARLPWKRIYTTNYDNIVEQCCQTGRQRVTPVTLGDSIYQLPKDHLLCVHLNGYVERLDRRRIFTELKLTDTSYLTASVVDSDWAMLLRQDLRLAAAVFFVGYSMYDIDIRRLLAATDDPNEKLFFCIGPTPDRATENRVKRYGVAIRKSAEDFARALDEATEDYVPRSNAESTTASAREVTMPSSPARITDSAFRDLLLWGKRSIGLVAESLRTGSTYYLHRQKSDDLLDGIEAGNRVAVITSDLGNGKSMLLEGMRLRAIERAFRVFDISEGSEGVDKDLEAIATCRDKAIVTIEEYQNWLDQIRLFSTLANTNVALVLTARTAVHDVLVDDLAEIVGDRQIQEMNIDLLTDNEIEWVVDALDQYGLWGVRAGFGKTKKMSFIQGKCRGQLHALLLDLLQSPDIGSRVAKVAERIRTKGANFQPLLSIFILTLLNHQPTLDTLVDIWGAEIIGKPQFRTDPIARELISFNSHSVVVRSPIAAEYVLSSCADAETIVSVLIKMAEQTEKGRNVSAHYNNIFKALMRFSSLQTILPEEGRRPAVIRYYESVKNLRGCRTNPLFWLQYAIGSLVMEDLPRAKTYFDTAYSLADKREFDTFQIDNHFSRFLIVEAIRGLPFSDAMANYRQARSIIDRQIRNERRHYPYRVAVNFQDFLNRYGRSMDEVEVEEFARTAARILDRINGLPDYRRFNRHVRRCQKALRYVVTECASFAKQIREKTGKEE